VGSYIIFVKKKDGTLRLYIDYWARNKITINNKYLVLRIDDLFEQLQGDGVFLKIDLKLVYHQLKLKSDHTSKIAFRTRYDIMNLL